jgi:hypothetical protein
MAKQYRISFAASIEYIPAHPDRTAYRSPSDDVEYREFPSRGAMLTTISMQSRRAAHRLDWKDWSTSSTAQRLRADMDTLWPNSGGRKSLTELGW